MAPLLGRDRQYTVVQHLWLGGWLSVTGGDGDMLSASNSIILVEPIPENLRLKNDDQVFIIILLKEGEIKKRIKIKTIKRNDHENI